MPRVLLHLWHAPDGMDSAALIPPCVLQWDTADAAKTYPLADLALLPEDQLAGKARAYAIA